MTYTQRRVLMEELSELLDTLHKADDPEPYKRALGAILECVMDSYLEGAFNAICKLHKIDPDDPHESYHRWLDGAE